jgi:SAM-dependent methyltransferase
LIYEKPYSTVAKIYSHLMRAIDYEDWAEYIFAINDHKKIEKEYILEIASGDCRLSGFLTQYFPKMILSDLSKQMLAVSNNSPNLRICCNMTRLPFKKKFPLIISAFDSVNYLLTQIELNDLFSNIRNILTDDGIFTFDVSLEKNSLKNERRLNRKGKVNGIKYVQKSKYDNAGKIHYNYFRIFLENGEIIEEVHKQKVYEFFDYFSVIESNGLYVENCYDSFSFDDADEDCERVQFVVKKQV